MDSMTLIELMQKIDGSEFFAFGESCLETSHGSRCGQCDRAGRHERSPEQVIYHNGYRDRSRDVGSF